MNTKHLLSILLLFPCSLWAIGSRPLPKATSALQFQQLSDTRVSVGDNIISFFTGNTERMMIDASGNVGVGTASPDQKLEVNGRIRAERLVSPKTGNLILQGHDEGGGNGFGIEMYAVENGFDFKTFSGSWGSRLSIQDNGNVGIGTTSPANKLEIVGDANVFAIKNATKGMADLDLNNYLKGVDKDDNLLWYIGDGSGAKRVIISARGDGAYPLDFEVNSNDRMRIDVNGNIGIGTTSPNDKLQVAGNISLGERMDNQTRYLGKPAIGAGGFGSNSNWIGFVSTTGEDYLTFGTHKSGSHGGERMRIDALGNVGIGTIVPDATLDVVRGSAYGGTAQFRGTQNISHFNYSTSEDTYIRGGKSTSKVIINDAGGNVGIGTTSPSHKLHVAGNIHGSTYSADSPPSWPDYVFEDSYQLSEIAEVEKYIEENHHLPEIPSAAEVKENGVDIVSMQAKLLQKIEELTLYVIELKKENEEQQKRIQKLEAK